MISPLISRHHAEIVQTETVNGETKYMIYDNSLNGTFVNDMRVPLRSFRNIQHPLACCDLRENDIITFGHFSGSSVLPGEYAPQATPDFSFVVEKMDPNRQYVGFDKEYNRVSTMICWSDNLPLVPHRNISLNPEIYSSFHEGESKIEVCKALEMVESILVSI
ncbi:unnamed protein product [Caenorhabditis bovis]|uniref:FHA domain-containing protein n=1 Tax=Caenorhabditis bovis TaxID=2654633 RepID=A0A8S1EY55_9PELO|nr:unnamed protein product [Caenorhabditis bovis]